MVHARCLSKDSPEPSTIQFEVVEDDLEEADIVFSRKLLEAEKKRNAMRGMYILSKQNWQLMILTRSLRSTERSRS